MKLTGGVYCNKDGQGNFEECFELRQPVIFMFYYDERSALLTITEDATLTQHLISEENSATELSKVFYKKFLNFQNVKLRNIFLQAKLNVKLEKLFVILCGGGILAMSCGEASIRLYDLENEENISLNLQTEKGFSRSDGINCIASCSVYGKKL